MNMLVETLGQVSGHPLVWAAVGLILAHGLFALFKWRLCPYLCGRASISHDEATARLNEPFSAGPGFFLVMLTGIGAVLAGLWLINAAIEPVYAFLLVIAGVFVVQIEPARLQLREAIAHVVASEAQGPDAHSVATKRLRDCHLWHVSLNFVLAGAISLGLAAF